TGNKIAELYQNQGNNFQEKTFRKVHEIANDPNKMAKDDYKYLIKGIAEGRIFVGGDNGLHLFNALVATIEGSDEEKKAELHDKLKRIDGGINSEFINNKEKAKKETKKLRGVKEEEETTEKVKDLIAETTETTEKKAETVSKTPDTNWSIEQPPRELIEKLNVMDRQILTLVKEEERLLKQGGNEKRIKEIDNEIDKIRKNSAEINEKWTNHMAKMLARFRALKFLSKRAGFDLNKVQKLTTWFLETGKDPTAGLEISKETGSTTQKRQQVKIKRIFYEKESSPIIEAQSPGQLMVEYSVVEDGKEITVESSYKNFLGMMDALDGHEDIDSPDYFNKQYGFELGYKTLQKLEGETFSKTGENPEAFRVEQVYEKNGKWYISLNNTVTKTSRHLLPYSINSALYFDRKQKDFELGEFGSFLQKNNYQRNISGDNMQETVNKSIEARNRECAGFIQGSSPEREEMYRAIGGVPQDSITIPQEGETKDIYFEHNGKRRAGKLKPLGGGEYEIEYEVGYNDPNWGEPEPAIAAVPPVEDPAKGGAEKRATVQKKKVNARNLYELANKGQIQDIQPAQPTQYEPVPIEQGEPMEYPPTQPTQPTEPGETGEIPEGEFAEGESSAGPKSDVQLAKPAFYKEALPYEEIHKVGGMERVEQSWLKAMWVNTRFMSVNDVWEMGKSMWEYYVRRQERRQKERYSKMGENLPFWAPEMQRINQSAENEEMGQFKESFDQKGVHEIIERLEKTSNRDEMKAALTALNEKGQMRWDNIDFWKNINKFVDPSLAIPIPSNGDPNTEVSSTDSRTGADFLKDAIDSLWGEGQFNEWYRQQKSTYLSNAKSYYEKGKELEGVEGGPGRRLAVLLDTHKRGEFVDPHEYEGLLLFSLDFGKATMQEKLYYMIEGVAAENMHGRTILSFDRMAHMNSEMLHKFPILEYMCSTVTREDGQKHTFTVDDYKQWVSWFDKDNKMNSTPTAAVDEFLWRYAIPNDGTQNRINKDLRNGENLDHDDMFAFLPPASTGVITDACKSTTGSKKFLTVEGYANVFPGFNQYFKSLSEYGYIDKLAEAVKSYVRFEGIMTDKFEKARTSAQDTYQRLDNSTLNSGTIVSPTTPPTQFIGELNQIVQKVVMAYENEELTRVTNLIFNSEPVEDVTTKEGQARQNEINQAYNKFEEIFKDIIKSDKGEKLISIVGGSHITGMKYMTPAETAKTKQDKAAK
ncbi:MAG: hypothetical protein GWP15_03285, partial [Nitrospirae bacterium]|nr:hypothetical protein [Nitrospirota bacterium]